MARNRLLWSPAAEADLIDIWNYFAANASPEIADEQLRRIESTCATVSEWPNSGRPRDELIPGLRSAAVAPHVVFYRFATAVEIVRVLHGSRDIDAIFMDG